MKIALRTLLVAAIAVMAYLCVISITTPIEFEREQSRREKEIVAKLVDIRTAQLEYQKLNGHFCASGDSLIDFILNGQLPVVLKEGTLTDEQLANGLTEAKAIAILKKGKQKEIEANGLQNFRRDTTLVSVYGELFAKKHSREEIKELDVIPFSNGQKFSFDTASVTNSVTGITLPLFEVKAAYDTYLYDLNRQQLINLKDKRTQLSKYCGLKVGSVEESNNHAGNWE